MRSVYRAIMAAICAFLTGCAIAQSVSTNGTMLADDLTSRSRVVVDAFVNSSNKVHDLIQNVSPVPDLSFSNDFVRCSMLTNEVGAIVTNEHWSGWTYEGLPNGAHILTSPEQQETSWFFSFGYSNEVYLGTGSYSAFPSNSSIVVFDCYTPLSTGRYNVTATRYRKNTLGLMTDNRFYSTITGEVSGIVTNVGNKWICTSGGTLYYSSNNGYWTGRVGESYFLILSYIDSLNAWMLLDDASGLLINESLVYLPKDSTILTFDISKAKDPASHFSGNEITFIREGLLSKYVTVPYLDACGYSKVTTNDVVGIVTNRTSLAPVYSQTPTFSDEWDVIPPTFNGNELVPVWEDGHWLLTIKGGGGDSICTPIYGTESDTTVHWADDIGGIYYEFTATRVRTDIIGYTLGSNTNDVLAAASITNSLSKSLAPTITNIASTVSAAAIASADTTYRRTIGLTNLNQSVQYVNITDPAPTTLAISMPTDGATKDWMVYVVSVTNVALSLPAATWWMADTAYTNDVPPATPTALWFSQVTDGIFILGRQELTEVTAP